MSLEMVEWGKFDTLAHITYPLRYMLAKAGETPSYKPYTETKLDAVLKALIQVGHRALEFNTSRPSRSGSPNAARPLKSIRRYKELGGKLVTHRRGCTPHGRCLQAA